MRKLEVDIQAGTLSLELREELWPLEELLTFATRENPKRAFLFVSKVLGRHWPCRPAIMRRTYDDLAAFLVASPGPVMVFGMAETATALGHGIYDSLLRRLPALPALYQHTTRHELALPIAFQIEESHSHAVEHTVYQPRAEYREIFATARTLVLVDDEISTGKTLIALAKAYLAENPRVERVELLALVSWLTAARLAEMAQELGRPIGLHALTQGSFEFAPRAGFQATPSQGTTRAARPGRQVSTRFGRLGFRGHLADPILPELPAASRVSVVGTGEFAFAPFRLAEGLEAAGHDVFFQSTTRSPILPGDAIQTKWTFPDHHDEGITNYLYNFPHEDRRLIVGYEHPELAETHALLAPEGAPDRLLWSPPEAKD